MTTIKRSEQGIQYLFGVLKDKVKTVTRVVFWKIPHKTAKEDICLKIGRYNKNGFSLETLELENPRSELTLDNEEFFSLLEFLFNNYEPFKEGIKKYIPIDGKLDEKSIKHLRAIFVTLINKNY